MIRKATLEDLKEIEKLYYIAVKHMIEEGNDNQWTDYKSFEAGVIKYINSGSFYVYYKNEELVGMFALIYGIDITYNVIRNGKWINDEPYATIHKIATKYYRKHIASDILEYIIEDITSKNIYNIRIDTHEKNVSMRKFLEYYNFKYCGIISITCNYEEIDSLRFAYIKSIEKNFV